VCNIECDIEAIQQVIEIETALSPKEKKNRKKKKTKQAAEKVSMHGRKLLPRFGVQCEARCQRCKSKKSSKFERKSK